MLSRKGMLAVAPWRSQGLFGTFEVGAVMEGIVSNAARRRNRIVLVTMWGQCADSCRRAIERGALFGKQ